MCLIKNKPCSLIEYIIHFIKHEQLREFLYSMELIFYPILLQILNYGIIKF